MSFEDSTTDKAARSEVNRLEKKFKAIFNSNPEQSNSQTTHLPKIIQAEKDKREFLNAALEQDSRRRQNQTIVALEGDPDASLQTLPQSLAQRLTSPGSKKGATNLASVLGGTGSSHKKGRASSIQVKGGATSRSGYDEPIFDHVRKNAETIKDMKMSSFDRTRARVETSMRRIHGEDPVGKYHKKSLIEALAPPLRSYFSRRRGFPELLEDVTKTNLCFSEVVEVVLCYRLELGQALNNLNTSYNKLFEKMLEQCFRHD